MILYSVPVSLYCAKTRIVLRHKGLDWEERPPKGGYGSAEYKTLVPSGNLPALDHDGLILCDSETIAEYVEERHPDPSMLPTDLADRARIRDRSRFHDTRLEPALRLLFPHVAPDRRDPAAVAAAAEGISARLAQLSALLALQADADGGVLTLGDCGYAPTFAWIDLLAAPMGFAVEWPAGVAAYRARIEAFPAVADELVAYRPGMYDWLAQRGAA